MARAWNQPTGHAEKRDQRERTEKGSIRSQPGRQQRHEPDCSQQSVNADERAAERREAHQCQRRSDQPRAPRRIGEVDGILPTRECREGKDQEAVDGGDRKTARLGQSIQAEHPKPDRHAVDGVVGRNRVRTSTSAATARGTAVL